MDEDDSQSAQSFSIHGLQLLQRVQGGAAVPFKIKL